MKPYAFDSRRLSDSVIGLVEATKSTVIRCKLLMTMGSDKLYLERPRIVIV